MLKYTQLLWESWSLSWKRRLTQTSTSNILQEETKKREDRRAEVPQVGASPKEVLRRVLHPDLPNSPLRAGRAPSCLTYSEGHSPWSSGPGLHSELTVMSGSPPTWPSNGQFCLGLTADAYLLAPLFQAAFEKRAADSITKLPIWSCRHPAPYIIWGHVESPALLGKLHRQTVAMMNCPCAGFHQAQALRSALPWMFVSPCQIHMLKCLLLMQWYLKVGPLKCE